MKTLLQSGLFAILLSLLSAPLFGQNLQQVVRGTIVDADTQLPLIGVQVVLADSDPLLGTTSDARGTFRLENVPMGRISLVVSYLGYESELVQAVEVNSGKEVVLNLELRQAIHQLEELIVKAANNRGEAVNEMALIGVRSVSADETERFAGGFSDPSRIVHSYAGVATTNDGDNEIIVRGNSPKYMQWRLEGLEITNPTHFADQNSVKGGISALNNKLLATSDFYTGAFAPEFSNALSGVYDVKLRSGNNEKFESTFGFGLLGTDLTFEGPFKKGYGGSYLVNYRYSTMSIVKDLGLIDIDGLGKFQDAAFKVLLPSKNKGVLSIFGLYGRSGIAISDVKPEFFLTPGDEPSTAEIEEDFDKWNYFLNAGISHSLPIDNRSYLKTSISFSGTGIDEEVYETLRVDEFDETGEMIGDSILSSHLDFDSKVRETAIRAAITYHHKINARNKLQVGARFSNVNYRYDQSWLLEDIGTRFAAADFDESMNSSTGFVSWKYRLNESVSILSGVNYHHLHLNDKFAIEPRIAMQWKLGGGNAINAGYGLHSSQESIHNYFAEVPQSDGSTAQVNQNLDLLKAHHFVLAYEKRFNANLRAKVEAYYQHLYNLPVENDPNSYYATINESNDFRYLALLNEGKGSNYGIEFTFERFLSKNYYYMLNASIFNSTYTAMDGKKRSTQYDGDYLINLLLGKEFDNLGKKANQTLSLNAKAFVGGGKKIIPLLRDENGQVNVDVENQQYMDYDKAYESSLDDVYSIVLSGSYKFNRPSATHEVFLTLDNVTNAQGKLWEYYDLDQPGSTGYVTQFGFFPNLQYKIYF